MRQSRIRANDDMAGLNKLMAGKIRKIVDGGPFYSAGLSPVGRLKAVPPLWLQYVVCRAYSNGEREHRIFSGPGFAAITIRYLPVPLLHRFCISKSHC
jgi:hypothetical protein